MDTIHNGALYKLSSELNWTIYFTEAENSTTTEEVSIVQCFFLNPNWLVWNDILPPKTCSTPDGWITGWLRFFHLVVVLNLVKYR